MAVSAIKGGVGVSAINGGVAVSAIKGGVGVSAINALDFFFFDFLPLLFFELILSAFLMSIFCLCFL